MRLIDDEGQQLGIKSLREALDLAKDRGLDLAEISPTADPPVCQILDSGKYQFEQRKKLSAARKKQKRVQIKEIKFRPGTEEADYQVKLRNIMRFLHGGDKVKVVVRFRGREMMHRDLGADLLQKVAEDLAEYGVVEQTSKMEGRQMLMVFAPKKGSKTSHHEKKEASV